VVAALLPGAVDQAVALDRAVVELLERLNVEYEPLCGVPAIHQHGLEVQLLAVRQGAQHLLDMMELGLAVAVGVVDVVADDPELLSLGVDMDAVDHPDALDHRLGVAAVLAAHQPDAARMALLQNRVVEDRVAFFAGHDLPADFLPDQPGRDPLPSEVTVGQVVAEATGVLGKVVSV